MEFSLETKLLILQFMKSFDSSIQNSDDKPSTPTTTTFQQFSAHVKQGLSKQSLTESIININENCDFDAVSEYMFENNLFDNVTTS